VIRLRQLISAKDAAIKELRASKKSILLLIGLLQSSESDSGWFTILHSSAWSGVMLGCGISCTKTPGGT
jgi:hypothetical protein